MVRRIDLVGEHFKGIVIIFGCLEPSFSSVQCVVTFVAYLILDYVRLLLVIVCTLSMTFSLYLYFNYLSTYV